MTPRLLSVFAMLVLLSACASTGSESGGGAGDGAMDGAMDEANAAPVNDVSTSGPMAGSVEEFEQVIGDRVLFDYDSSALDQAAMDVLTAQAAFLTRYPGYAVVVEGHCDERGTREYNLALGERRASAVKDYLVSMGVPASRISTISYGKERPAVVGSTPYAWSQNRRGVLVLDGQPGS